MTSHGFRKRRYCFALVTAASVATIAAHVPQHRVKHPLKTGHVITQSQKERVLPFLPVDYVPGATPSQNSASFWHEESDQSWHLHCNAALVSPETVLNGRKKMPKKRIRRRRTEATTSAFSAQQTLVRESAPSTVNLDSLLSQVGADNSSATSSGNISTVVVFAPINTTTSSATSSWNISTEVEFAQINTTTANATSNVTASVVYSTSASIDNPTSTPYQPMRIRAILTENSWLSTGDTSILFQDILSPAILAWSAALRVDPVVGNLTIHADQLYDGETCGPGKHSGYPSATVPLLHLESGIPDTDFVIYLSLAFRHGIIDPKNTTNNFQVNSSSVDPNTSFGEGGNDFSTTTAQGSKINLTDALFGDTVGGTDFGLPNISVKPTCTGDYLAAATYCSTDQYDRPTAAMLHLCIDEHSFSTNIPKTIVTVMHEIGHALGFNPQSLAHFRTQDGRPVTERDDDGNVVDVKVKCTGVDQETEVIPLPSKDILQFRRVRNGVRVAEIVTPTVRQVVRNHFDCQGLQGAELESGIGDTGGSCLGDHWERRLFREDLMNPIIDEVPFSLRISPLTLALFADSGWYQVDLSRATYPAAWGRGTGCPFVNETCIDREDGSVTTVNAPFFCNNIVTKGLIHEIHGCSPDMTRKATCSIAQYDSELPSQYQYFGATFGVNYGGKEEYLDYCPVFSGFSNGECMERENALVMKVSPLEDFGSTNSRCLTGLFQGIQTALCLQIACVVQDQTLRVKVDGTWRLCTRAGEELLIESDPNMVVTCPDPVRTCPTFYCNRDCLGTSGGICDFRTGDCMCSVQMANSTAANGTNATLVIPCEKVDVVKQDANDPMLFGVTKYEYDLLSDAPFPDYYVPTSHDLENDRTSILGTVGIILVCAGVFVLLLFVSMGAWRYLPSGGFDAGTEVLRRFRIADSNGPDVPEEIEVTRNNKDKFVASMLLNLRLHYPQLQSQASIVSELENYSETESSVTENSARFSVPSSNTDSDNDIDTSNRELHTVQAQEEEVHPVMVIRRRFKAGDV